MILFNIDAVPRSSSHRVAYDDRTWRQRLDAAHANWKQQIPLLVAAYLKFEYGGDTAQPQQSDTAQRDTEQAPQEPELTGKMRVLDFYTLESEVEYSVRPGERTSEALVGSGYLPNSPVSPSIAISIKTLELLRSLRLFKASFSTEAFTKLICHKYLVGFSICNSPMYLYIHRYHIVDTIGLPLRTHSTSMSRSCKLSTSA